MAYLAQRARGRWELRESVSTTNGPRSRTLASFDQLTDDVLRKAAERATRPFDAAAVRESARRKGVIVALPPAERAARQLTGLLAQGATITPVLAGVLQTLLDDSTPIRPSHAAQSAAQWVGASADDRAHALEDLLLLADALPQRPRPRELTFPRLQSAPVPAP
jgi:hypothetical protein